jgi:Tfp pilus assembly protein PilO
MSKDRPKAVAAIVLIPIVLVLTVAYYGYWVGMASRVKKLEHQVQQLQKQDNLQKQFNGITVEKINSIIDHLKKRKGSSRSAFD